MKSISLIIISAVLITGFQNCEYGLETQSTGSLGNSNSSLFNGPSAKSECQFIGADALSLRLQALFDIPEGDVPVLDKSGRSTNKYRIHSSLADLGVEDTSKGLINNLSCGMTKFKVSTEVFVDACSIGLQRKSTRDRLFPDGPSDYNAIYLSFIGRSPTSFEVQTLDDLQDQLPENSRAIGVCAAVASSLESLTQI